ncbi:MAG: 16S rRNA (cytosine(1402)-N(4))-methyltransferase RsmH [Armatimonadetes bacterium]|nr:16S rRNA (cytosine(1402)-N(4))-methyltransferase RsmH [Armatimonadota bacterium]
MSDYHTPVMLEEALEYLAPRPGGTYVDATLGGGGYAAAMMPLCAPGGRVVGVDRDTDALAEASSRLDHGGAAFLPVHGNFAELDDLLRNAGISEVDGVVFDLGVSSYQLNAGERGFSFRYDAPLDMRMDRSHPYGAAELLQELPEREIARILKEYGEEKWAARIAKFIVEARTRSPLQTTGDLVRVIEAAVPKAARPKEIHVATRTFQALRIAVNRELESLEAGLDAAMDRLASGGRLVAVSYHSLEDRIVKNRIQQWENPCICPPSLPACGCGRSPVAKSLTRKPVLPTDAEVERNPRARSAKLRAAEKL